MVNTIPSNTTQGHPGNIAESALLDNARQQEMIKQHAAILSATGGAVSGDNGRVEQRSDVSNVDDARYDDHQRQSREPPPPSTTGKPPLNKALIMAQYYAMASKLARQQQQPKQHSQPQQKQIAPHPQAHRPQRVITPGMIARRPIEMKHNIIMRSGNHKTTDSVSGSVNTDATEQIYNTKMANSRRKMDTALQSTTERLDTFDPRDIDSSSNDNNLISPEKFKRSQSTKSDVSKNSLKTEAEFVLQNSPRKDVAPLLTIDNEYLQGVEKSSATNQERAQKHVSATDSTAAEKNDCIRGAKHSLSRIEEDTQKQAPAIASVMAENNGAKHSLSVNQDDAKKQDSETAVAADDSKRLLGAKHVLTLNQEDTEKQKSSHVSAPDSDLTKIAVGLETQLEKINSKVEYLQKELIMLARPQKVDNTKKHAACKDWKSEDSIDSRKHLKDDSNCSGQELSNNMEIDEQEYIMGKEPSMKSNRRMNPDGLSKDSDESGLSIAMKSTLSHAEFLSVQSSITTDQAAFKQRPGVLKRTASLVRNPALALRRSKANKDAEELAKRIKHAQTLARHDNRTKEVYGSLAHPKCELEDCSNDIIQNDDTPELITTRKIIGNNKMAGNNVVHYHATDCDEMPYEDLALGVESMYEETDIILDTNGTFDHPSTRNQRVIAQQHPTSHAYTSPYYYDAVASVPSKETATQTTPLDNTISGNDVGSISNVMESLGLFGARFCMGTSKVMLSCADSCSDNPNGKKVLDRRLSSFDTEVMARLSPSNGVVTSQASIPLHHTPPSTRRCSMLPPFGDKKESEQEAAGIFTRALSMALQATIGESNKDQQLANLKQQVHETSNLPQNHINQHPRHKTKKQANADFESVDGRFVSPEQVHRRKTKHVPRDIAVTPKRRHRHESHCHEKAAGGGSNSDESGEAFEVKKPSKSSRKGIGKFFHKIGLSR